MTDAWSEWDHITKIDPDKSLADGETFEDVCETDTDALEIGGTTDMTQEKMSRVIDACAKYDVPLYQEPSNPGVVIDDDALDGYLVPTVFNAQDSFWITGAHKEWVRVADGMDWDRTHTEAYIVLNPDASVATYTDADTDQSAEDVASFAAVAERMFGQEVVYVEYSGTYGDRETVRAAHDALDDATLFYGGGIHDYDTARGMAEVSDVVVVGDLLHDEGVDAVRETVEGAKDANADGGAEQERGPEAGAGLK
jgi:phosphoglycerol geranylgeranyltransferase